MAEPARIAVVGSINLDFVIQTERLPVAGETVSGGTFFTTPGGKGGNQALAAQKLGAQVAMVACVGNDPYAQAALANLEAAGVDLSGLMRLDGIATGAAFIGVDAQGENQITVASGANAAFTPERAPAITADWIIAQQEVAPETVQAAAQKSDAKLCLNAAPVKPVPQALLDRADLIVVNEIEYESYKSQLASLDALIALTLGGAGAELHQNGKTIAKAAAPKVDVKDTTGAGDCFVAALTVFLAQGHAPQAALSAACHCGALATTQLGAQSGTPSLEDVKAAFPHLDVFRG
ncbi:MAG: ribokinase [Pseudomonadota bacterium]